MACTRCARTPNSRCVASLKPAVSRIVRLASRRPARDFGIGARPTVFQVHTMVRLAANVASWQTKMSSAAAMVSLPSAVYPPCASQRDGRHRAPPHTLARHSKGHEGEAGQPVRRGLPGRPHHQPSLVITKDQSSRHWPDIWNSTKCPLRSTIRID
jgi:hypothetical protein